jgi:hypothetical protein
VCGIVGTLSTEELYPLLGKIAPRGTRAFSLTAIDLDNYERLHTVKVNAAYSDTLLDSALAEMGSALINHNHVANKYYIAHLQSPTSSNFSYHPAESIQVKGDNATRHFLWHNGQMDSHTHQSFKDAQGVLPWDTGLLLSSIVEDFDKGLSEFQGSFAAIYLKEGSALAFFKNAIAPLFVNETTVCSVPFDKAAKVEKNFTYYIRSTKTVEKALTSTWANTYNPYGV